MADVLPRCCPAARIRFAQDPMLAAGNGARCSISGHIEAHLSSGLKTRQMPRFKPAPGSCILKLRFLANFSAETASKPCKEHPHEEPDRWIIRLGRPPDGGSPGASQHDGSVRPERPGDVERHVYQGGLEKSAHLPYG